MKAIGYRPDCGLAELNSFRFLAVNLTAMGKRILPGPGLGNRLGLHTHSIMASGFGCPWTDCGHSQALRGCSRLDQETRPRKRSAVEFGLPARRALCQKVPRGPICAGAGLTPRSIGWPACCSQTGCCHSGSENWMALARAGHHRLGPEYQSRSRTPSACWVLPGPD